MEKPTLRLIYGHDLDNGWEDRFPGRPCLALIGPFEGHTDRLDVQNALNAVLRLANGYKTEKAAADLVAFAQATKEG